MRTLRIIAVLAVLALLATACGGGDGDTADAAAAAAAGGDTAEEAADTTDVAADDVAAAEEELIDEFLLAPDDAEVFQATGGDVVTGPTTGNEFELPYQEVLPVEEGPIGDSNEEYTLCFSQALLRHPWAVAQREAVEVQAAKHPNLEVLYFNTDNDPLEQVSNLETCMAQNVDAILVWPHSVDPLTPIIEQAHDQGFTIIGMERTVATDAYDTWIYLDYEAATRQLAEAAAEIIGETGAVAETSGAVGSSPQILRHAGFASALEEVAPGIELVTTPPTDYSRAQGYEVALDFLQSPDGEQIDAWYVHSGEIAIGVARAMEETGRTDIPILTIDGNKTEVAFVQAGVFSAVAPWTPLHADIAVRAAIRHIEGEEVPTNILLDSPELITPENADEQLAAAWGEQEDIE